METVRKKYQDITNHLISRGITITTMESCTSGQIASLLTDTEGASAVLKGAFITYSNEAKVKQGVPSDVIERYGVYSEETAEAMAKACRSAYRADIGVGVTGSFGNADPNNKDSVPGEVFFAVSYGTRIFKARRAIPPQPDRISYKMYMADLVADSLKEILGT